MADKEQPHIVVNDMTLAYGSNLIQRKCQLYRQPW